MSELAVAGSTAGIGFPALIAGAGDSAARRFPKFLTVHFAQI